MREPPSRHATLYALALATFAIGTEGFMITAILPTIGRSLSVSAEAAGQLVTIFALVYAVSSPLLTAAFDGVHRRTSLLGSLAAFVLANLVAAAASGYAARGLDLILIGRRADRLEALAGRLRTAGQSQVEVAIADLAHDADVRQTEQLVGEHPGLNLVVNNAGSGALGVTEQADAAAVDAMLRVNINALTSISLAAGRRFAREGHGAIVNIASVLAFIPASGAAAYAGSKSYVLNFTRSLHDDLAAKGVHVQAVLPGPVRTEFFGDTPAPFPDAMFMTAEDLVDAALAGLDQGETVTIPTLDDVAVGAQLEDARRALAAAVMREGFPATRYRTQPRD